MREFLIRFDLGKMQATNFLGCAALYLKEYDSSIYTYSLLQGRMVDCVGTMAQCALFEGIEYSLRPRFEEEEMGVADRVSPFFLKHRTTFAASTLFTANVSYEVMQMYNILPGTYDPGDFVAYGLGALGWAALHRSAKYLYDSGLTDPINRALRFPRRCEA